MDDIARQARQGSVAAIIQILNQKLAPDEVRTRAVFSANILQLLCEAAEEEKLERNKIIDRVREILEAISPRGIRRVNINCRLVREQQLLWFEEINRDPANQLLWSEQIVLAKPNIIKRLLEDARNRPKEQSKQAFAPEIVADRQVRQSNQLWHGFLWGAGVMLAIVAAWGFYRQSLGPVASGKVVEAERSLPASAPATTPAATPAPTPATKAPEALAPDESTENFARAVRLAQQAVEEGKLAKNADDWLVIAANWDQASKLMASVSQEHPEYATAQNRAALYRRYSQNTQAKAEKLRKTQKK